jgi:hypothetical protein
MIEEIAPAAKPCAQTPTDRDQARIKIDMVALDRDHATHTRAL